MHRDYACAGRLRVLRPRLALHLLRRVLWSAVILIGALVCLAAIFGSGCTPRYTVIPADREVVPVKQTGDKPRVYTEAVDDATGWYIPDATLLDLLEAD